MEHAVRKVDGDSWTRTGTELGETKLLGQWDTGTLHTIIVRLLREAFTKQMKILFSTVRDRYV